MKVELENIKIGKSGLTDTVFAGITNTDNLSWKHKVDITPYFMKACVDRFCGFKENFQLGEKTYEISCREVEPENEECIQQ